jgi:hypothetical protein
MYTNTLARRLSLEHFASAQAGWQEWAREREECRRAGLDVWTLEKELARFASKQAMETGAGLSAPRDAGQDKIVPQNKQEDAELALLLAEHEREEQEELDRLHAERIQAEDNAARTVSGPSIYALDYETATSPMHGKTSSLRNPCLLY